MMPTIFVAMAIVGVCQGGAVSFSRGADPWSSPLASALADPLVSATVSEAERASQLQQGWQQQKLNEYKERLEERLESETQLASPGAEGILVGRDDPFFPFRLRDPSLYGPNDVNLVQSAGPLFQPDVIRDVVIAPEEKVVENGFRVKEYSVNRPSTLLERVSFREKLPVFAETENVDVDVRRFSHRPGVPFYQEGKYPDVVVDGVSRFSRNLPEILAEHESPLRRLLLPRGPFRSGFYTGSPLSSIGSGTKVVSDKVLESAAFSSFSPFRGPLAPTSSLVETVPSVVFERPASIALPPSFKDFVTPAYPFSPYVRDTESLFRSPLSAALPFHSFLDGLDPKLQGVSLIRGFYGNKRQYLFDIMTEVVRFCNCGKTLSSLKYWWGGFQDNFVVAESEVEETRGFLGDLGLMGPVAFDNFRNIAAGVLPPPRTLQDFRDEFLGGLLDSVCRSAKSYVADVQNYIDSAVFPLH